MTYNPDVSPYPPSLMQEYDLLTDKKLRRTLSPRERDRLQELRNQIAAIDEQRSRPDTWDVHAQKLRQELAQLRAEVDALPDATSIPGSPESQVIYIIDDEQRTCVSYGDTLERAFGVRPQYTSGANTKERALDRLRKGFTPSLVLLDVWLPTPEDSLEICRFIKQGTLRPETQVVMITAVADADDILEACLEAGADDFLGKGTTSREFIARIRGKLRAQALYTQLFQAQRNQYLEHPIKLRETKG